MPTLSSANSLFELAFGVNAVLPVLISDFDRVREQAAESLLRKIKEHCPDFELKEQDRLDFIDFAFRSSRGLRHALQVTRTVSAISVVLCGASLGVLVLSALMPDLEITTTSLFVFVGMMLIFGPLLYVARDRYLKWLYSILVIHGTNEKADAELFANCVAAYLTYKKRFESLDRDFNEAMVQLPFIIWKARFMLLKVKLEHLMRRLRSKLSFKWTR